jgi:hypothetical protein
MEFRWSSKFKKDTFEIFPTRANDRCESWFYESHRRRGDWNGMGSSAAGTLFTRFNGRSITRRHPFVPWLTRPFIQSFPHPGRVESFFTRWSRPNGRFDAAGSSEDTPRKAPTVTTRRVHDYVYSILSFVDESFRVRLELCLVQRLLEQLGRLGFITPNLWMDSRSSGTYRRTSVCMSLPGY